MSSNCVACKTEVTLDNLIVCDLCRSAFHSTCSGLSRSELQFIKTKNRKLVFYCSNCSDIKIQLNKVRELTSIVGSLQKEIESLKGQLASVVTTVQSERGRVLDPLEIESVIQEVAERGKRKNNLIIFNLPELADGSKVDQTAADAALIKDMFSSINISIDLSTPARLGKYDLTNRQQQRPIGVTLPDGILIPHVLGECRKFKSIERFQTVAISKDRTPFQVKLYKSAKQQLSARLPTEPDLIIKYFNDVPKIVSRSRKGN